MAIGNVFEHLPRVLPDGRITIEETHTFTVLEYQGGGTSTKYVYTLDKAPFESVRSVSGTVDGNEYTFVDGADYQVVDDDSDGELDSIDFDVGGEHPDPNTEFTVEYVAESIISRYIDAHESAIDTTDVKIDEVIDSRQLNNASGSELDRIGAIFGRLGDRRGRSDSGYRAFLGSIAQSFNGRGTVPGLRFAIAAGLGEDVSSVLINEDFVNNSYFVTLVNIDSPISIRATRDLAELADPSGVGLEQINLPTEMAVLITTSGTTVTATDTGLGSGTLTLDGSSTLQ